MIYGRSVVGGYGKFMKLRPMKGLLNIYIATVGAFVSGSQEAVKEDEKGWWWSYCNSKLYRKLGIYR